MPAIELSGQTIEYRLRQSKRAKRLSIRFKPHAGFEVVYPVGKSQLEAIAFFEAQQSWVLKTWGEAQSKEKAIRQSRQYVNGAELLWLGGCISLQLLADGDNAFYAFKESQLEITLPQRLHEDQSLIHKIVADFYRAQAKRYLPARTRDLAQLHGFRYKMVRVKNQKTRWGSCSAKQNINLNMRLMMAPDSVIDYVIIHELCHLRELNHSPAFWALVASFCPDYRRWKAWLQRHGASLAL